MQIVHSNVFTFLAGEYFIQNAGVAQMVEHLTCNQDVVGSSPIASSTYESSRNRAFCM